MPFLTEPVEVGFVTFTWRQVIVIAVAFLVAWLIHLLSGRLARRFAHLNRLTPRGRRLRAERRETLTGLFSGIISFLAFGLAAFVSLTTFVDADTLIWVIGLFSAAFGFGARLMVGDFLAGLGFIVDDTFDVGDKVQIPVPNDAPVEGTIETVNVRNTEIRAPSGELFTVPNGEIRVVRNFSRGRFSTANVRIRLVAEDLPLALTLLNELGQEAAELLPDLLEPWRVINESGELAKEVELTLLAKTRYGKGAEVRPRILALLHERLASAEVDLVA